MLKYAGKQGRYIMKQHCCTAFDVCVGGENESRHWTIDYLL